MRAITSKEAKELDLWAIEKLGIPRAALMENAGRETAETVLSETGEGSSIVLVGGPGNNGGDGFVAARYLKSAGHNISAFLLGKSQNVKGEAKVNLDIAKNLGVKIIEITEEKDLKHLKQALSKAQIVIDAIFGTGLSRSIQGLTATVVDLINSAKTANQYKIISVDVPSGLDATTGKVGKHCIKSDITVTFAYPKIGLLEYPGSDFSGKIVIVDIGIPKLNPLFPEEQKSQKKIIRSELKGSNIIDSSRVSKIIPQRKAQSHKGTYGNVFILGGSSGMSGALIMAARGSLRSGAGLVRIGLPESLRNITDAMCAETITIGLKETNVGTLSSAALSQITEHYQKSEAFAVGPGMSTNKETVELIKSFVTKVKRTKNGAPLVIDADALNALSDNMEILKNSKIPIIITPHPGEAARITKKKTSEIQKKRAEIAKGLSKRLGVITVLKGAYTVIASQKGEAFINVTGNPGMATAGMGDVLTGVISGLAAQGLPPINAAIAGVYLHGLAGDIGAKLKGELGLIASDVIEALPYAIKSVREG